MKRFITINEKDLQEVLKVIRDAGIRILVNEAYDWVKQELKKRNVPHNDQQANHHRDLPHQGGYVSFYIDQQGVWMQQRH